MEATVLCGVLVVAVFLWTERDRITGPPMDDEMRSLCIGKTKGQQKVLLYFLKQDTCFWHNMTDEQYMSRVEAKIDIPKIMKKAIEELDVDEDEVKEVKPIVLQGFRFDDKYLKITASGVPVSNVYEVTIIFSGNTRLYFYTERFYMDRSMPRVHEEEDFPYKNISSIKISSATDSLKEGGESVEFRSIKLSVQGEKYNFTIGSASESNVEKSVRAIRNKMREVQDA